MSTAERNEIANFVIKGCTSALNDENLDYIHKWQFLTNLTSLI